MATTDYITVNDLYAYAKENRLLDARIRICDGMAVSYYPDPQAVSKSRYEIVIDVSANTPIEYDDLDEYAQNWHRIADQHLDALEVEARAMYTAERASQQANSQRTAQRREYLRQRQSRVNAGQDPDMGNIYGYGPYRRRR